jgi:hypothetical protein
MTFVNQNQQVLSNQRDSALIADLPDSEPIQQFRRKLPIPKEIQEKSRAKQARLGITSSAHHLRNEPDNKVWGSYTVYCQPGLFLF